MNSELRDLYAADQTDRSDGMRPGTADRDRGRRQRVAALLAVGAAHTAEDYIHAAMVFQHGEQLDDYRQAHELAQRAVALGGGGPARWLAAAAYDRWLTNQGKQQKYGTQYVGRHGRWELCPVDPATTDAERAAWNVPSLAEALARAEQRSRESPPKGNSYVRGAATLATVEVPGLRVDIVRTPHELVSSLPPTPEPLPQPLLTGSEPPPRPEALPAGLQLCRYGGGWGATRPDGRVGVFWQELAVPEGNLLLFGWKWPVAPVAESIAIDTRPAIWIGGADEAWSFVLVRHDPARCLLIGGPFTRSALVPLAASLS